MNKTVRTKPAWTYADSNQADEILDFEQGQDKIDLSEIGLMYSDLAIETENGWTGVMDGTDEFGILLQGEYDLVESDFVF